MGVFCTTMLETTKITFPFWGFLGVGNKRVPLKFKDDIYVHSRGFLWLSNGNANKILQNFFYFGRVDASDVGQIFRHMMSFKLFKIVLLQWWWCSQSIERNNVWRKKSTQYWTEQFLIKWHFGFNLTRQNIFFNFAYEFEGEMQNKCTCFLMCVKCLCLI